MHNQLALITLPADFTTGIASNTSALATDFSPYIYLVLGVLLITVVIEVFVGALRRH